MRLNVIDEQGRAKILLINGRETIGIASMAWHEYERAVRDILRTLLESARASVAKTLGERLWQDAQRLVPLGDNSAELAQAKLLEFGWTKEMIDSYADALAKSIAEKMTEKLPVHR